MAVARVVGTTDGTTEVATGTVELPATEVATGRAVDVATGAAAEVAAGVVVFPEEPEPDPEP